MTKLLQTKINKIPEIGYFSDVPGRIRNSSDNSGMPHGISRGALNVDLMTGPTGKFRHVTAGKDNH